MNPSQSTMGAPRLRLTARHARHGASITRDVGADGITIGRAPDNGMPLPDPERFVSARHAVIDQTDGVFRVTDTSTNGTYVNGDGVPLGAGQSRVLRPDDRLRVGLYEIAVEEAPSATAARPGAIPMADVPLPDVPSSAVSQPAMSQAMSREGSDAGAQGLSLGLFTAGDGLRDMKLPEFGGGSRAGGPLDVDATIPDHSPAPPPASTNDVLASLVSDLIGGTPAANTSPLPAGGPGGTVATPPEPAPIDRVGLTAAADPAGVPVSPFAAFTPGDTPGGNPGGNTSGNTSGGLPADLASAGGQIAGLASATPARAVPPPPAPAPVAAPAPPEGTLFTPLYEPQIEAGDAAPSGQVIQFRLPGVSVDGRPADPATLALAAFWAGFGSFPDDLRAGELPGLMHQLGAALREACDGVDDLLADAGGRPRIATRAQTGRLRLLLAARGRGGRRLDDAMREGFEHAAERRRAQDAAVEAGLHKVTDTLSAASLGRRFANVIQAVRQRRRDAELWRLFGLMAEELKQIAELQFHKEVDAQMRRDDAQPGMPVSRP